MLVLSVIMSPMKVDDADPRIIYSGSWSIGGVEKEYNSCVLTVLHAAARQVRLTITTGLIMEPLRTAHRSNLPSQVSEHLFPFDCLTLDL